MADPVAEGSKTTSSSPTRSLPRKGRRSAARVIVPIVIVILLVGGYFLWKHFDAYESTDDAEADVHLYPVSARISGYVVNVNVDDNQWVQQGTVLVQIDPKDYEAAVAQERIAIDVGAGIHRRRGDAGRKGEHGQGRNRQGDFLHRVPPGRGCPMRSR